MPGVTVSHAATHWYSQRKGQTWEQATQFSTSVSDVMITHVAFYKAAGETGTHFARIWNDTGVPLTPPIQFTNETPGPGWPVQAFPSPLFISPNVKYRVSYNINSVVPRLSESKHPEHRGTLNCPHQFLLYSCRDLPDYQQREHLVR